MNTGCIVTRQAYLKAILSLVLYKVTGFACTSHVHMAEFKY